MGAYEAELRRVAETEGIEKARWLHAATRALLKKCLAESWFDEELDLECERRLLYAELEEKVGTESARRMFKTADELAHRQSKWKHLRS